MLEAVRAISTLPAARGARRRRPARAVWRRGGSLGGGSRGWGLCVQALDILGLCVQAVDGVEGAAGSRHIFTEGEFCTHRRLAVRSERRVCVSLGPCPRVSRVPYLSSRTDRACASRPPAQGDIHFKSFSESCSESLSESFSESFSGW